VIPAPVRVALRNTVDRPRPVPGVLAASAWAALAEETSRYRRGPGGAHKPDLDLTGVAMTTALVLALSLYCAPTASPQASAYPDCLDAWAARVLYGPTQPDCKRRLAEGVLRGDAHETAVGTTWYSPDDSMDRTGGSWTAAWMGGRLRWGHVAKRTGGNRFAYGEVFYAPPPYDHSWVVVDCGPGVPRGSLDVCCPTRAALRVYQRARAQHGSRLTVWRLGRITRREAR